MTLSCMEGRDVAVASRVTVLYEQRENTAGLITCIGAWQGLIGPLGHGPVQLAEAISVGPGFELGYNWTESGLQKWARIE